MRPLAHQRQPDAPWARWVVTGSRATGKTWAMEEMALDRALSGEHVAYVVPPMRAPLAVKSLADHGAMTELTGRDPLAWDVNLGTGTIRIREGRTTIRGGMIQVVTLGAEDRVRGLQFQTGIIDDPREHERHLERPMVQQLRTAGMQRIAYARFDSEGTGEIAVRSWFSTDAP